MTYLLLSEEALANCRFAISPLAETVGVLITLQRRCSDPSLAEWHARHQHGYRTWLASDPVVGILLPLIASTKRLPDVLTLPPRHGMNTALDDELNEVASHTDDETRAAIDASASASWRHHDITGLDQRGLQHKLADILNDGWGRFVADDWPRRRAILERDVMYRAGLLATYGWKHAIETMKQRPVWVSDNGIRFSDQDLPDRTIDTGLIFVPRTTTGGWWLSEKPPRYALTYCAHGPLAQTSPATAADALPALLGAGRSRILRELQHPATSTQLAHTLQVSLGTVSTHITVLRDAGVISGTRLGRNVVYRCTHRGNQLLKTLGSETPPAQPLP